MYRGNDVRRDARTLHHAHGFDQLVEALLALMYAGAAAEQPSNDTDTQSTFGASRSSDSSVMRVRSTAR